MAKNMFYIDCVSSGKVHTINKISEYLWRLLNELSKFDITFKNATLQTENQASISIEINEMEKDVTIQTIASTILMYHRRDIRKYEKEMNPTADFSREFGFSVVVTFYKQKKKCYYFIFRMGSNQLDSISLSFLDLDIQYDFDWYFQVLKVFVNSINAYRGGVFLRASSYISETAKYNERLGWITYFSNDNELKIPNKLKGFEYEYTENGKYLIATRDDFTVNKETYQAQKEKLLSTMEYLGETVPGYLKL